MNLFQNHVKHFENILQVIKEKLTRTILVDDRSKDSIDIPKLLDEANELLEQIELETRDMPSNDRHNMESYVSQNRQQLLHLNQQYKSAYSLSANYAPNDPYDEDDEKHRLLANMERLDQCSDHLDHGYKMALESEKVGSVVMNDLKCQRESLERSHNRLREMNTDLGKSSRILTGMMRRILQNRIVLGAVAVFMILVIIITIWVTKRRK